MLNGSFDVSGSNVEDFIIHSESMHDPSNYVGRSNEEGQMYSLRLICTHIC